MGSFRLWRFLCLCVPLLFRSFLSSNAQPILGTKRIPSQSLSYKSLIENMFSRFPSGLKSEDMVTPRDPQAYQFNSGYLSIKNNTVEKYIFNDKPSPRHLGLLQLVMDVLERYEIPDIRVEVNQKDRGDVFPIAGWVTWGSNRPALLFPNPRFGAMEFPWIHQSEAPWEMLRLSNSSLEWARGKRGFTTWEADMALIREINANVDYLSKRSKAFFMGLPHRGPRKEFFEHAGYKRNLYEAIIPAHPLHGFAEFSAEASRLERRFPGWVRHHYVGMQHWAMHRCVIHIHGESASDRLRFLLALNATVIWVHPQAYQEFWYPSLRPWVHYLPARDLDDLDQKAAFCANNVTKAMEIARNGMKFVNDHLQYEQVLEYFAVVLRKYANLYGVHSNKT